MAWVAVDKDGTEAIYSKKPLRSERIWLDRPHPSTRVNDTMNLPSGSIERLIGRRLTWEDDPVKLNKETLAKTVEVTDAEINQEAQRLYEVDDIMSIDDFVVGAKFVSERMKR